MDSRFRGSDEERSLFPAVIPAQAGIQSFVQQVKAGPGNPDPAHHSSVRYQAEAATG
mgnify:CR=1 FL=1